MMSVRISPDVPTRHPETTSTELLIARPANAAARPEKARPLYEKTVQLCRERGFHVGTGVFGAEMMVESVNDGPVTIILDTEEL